jgi:hypothetical protein
VHATTLVPEQESPAPEPHPVGVAGHMQLALGKEPPHGLPEGQLVLDASTTHPLASRPHVSSLPAAHSVPVPAAQSVGVAGHVQAADGSVPAHGLLVGQVIIALIYRQPLALRAQVRSWVVPLHVAPIPPAHAVGVAGHWHDAAGAAP